MIGSGCIGIDDVRRFYPGQFWSTTHSKEILCQNLVSKSSPFRGCLEGKIELAHEIGQTSIAISLSLQISIIFGCFTIENLTIGWVLLPT